MVDESKVFYVIQFKDENCFKCGFAKCDSVEDARERLEKNLPEFEYLLIEKGYDKGKENAILNKVNTGYEPRDLFTVRGKRRYPVRGNRKFFTLPDGVNIKSLLKGEEVCYLWIRHDKQALKMTKAKPAKYVWCSLPLEVSAAKKKFNDFKALTIKVDSSNKKEYCFKFDKERPTLDDVLIAIDGSLRFLVIEKTSDNWVSARYSKNNSKESTPGFHIVSKKLVYETDAKQFKTNLYSLAGGGKKIKFGQNVGYKRVVKISEKELDSFVDKALDMKSPLEVPKLLWLLECDDYYIMKSSRQPLDVWAAELLETKTVKTVLSVPHSNLLKKALEANSNKKSVNKDEYSIELRNFKKDPVEIYEENKGEEYFAYLIYFPELKMYRYGASTGDKSKVPSQKIFTSLKCDLLCTKYATMSQAKYEINRIDKVFERIEDHREDGCYFRLGGLSEEKLVSEFLGSNFIKE